MAIYVILHVSLRIDLEYFLTMCRRETLKHFTNEFQMMPLVINSK